MVHVVNRMTATDVWVLRILSELVLLCLDRNILICAKQVAGLDNGITDTLSRLQWERFSGLVPGSEKVGCQVPSDLWDIGL